MEATARLLVFQAFGLSPENKRNYVQRPTKFFSPLYALFTISDVFLVNRSRGGSSHEPARFGLARAGFSMARPGSLVNFGSSSLSVKWLGSSQIITARQLGEPK